MLVTFVKRAGQDKFGEGDNPVGGEAPESTLWGVLIFQCPSVLEGSSPLLSRVRIGAQTRRHPGFLPSPSVIIS